jgi:hypothetical protein
VWWAARRNGCKMPYCPLGLACRVWPISSQVKESPQWPALLHSETACPQRSCWGIRLIPPFNSIQNYCPPTLPVTDSSPPLPFPYEQSRRDVRYSGLEDVKRLLCSTTPTRRQTLPSPLVLYLSVCAIPPTCIHSPRTIRASFWLDPFRSGIHLFLAKTTPKGKATPTHLPPPRENLRPASHSYKLSNKPAALLPVLLI